MECIASLNNVSKKIRRAVELGEYLPVELGEYLPVSLDNLLAIPQPLN